MDGLVDQGGDYFIESITFIPQESRGNLRVLLGQERQSQSFGQLG